MLDAVVSLVRRLVLAARTGPHGKGRSEQGHRSQNCDGCAAVKEGFSFLAAMSGDGDSLATGDPEAGQPARRLVSVPAERGIIVP